MAMNLIGTAIALTIELALVAAGTIAIVWACLEHRARTQARSRDLQRR
jgi:hypothetical protein